MKEVAFDINWISAYMFIWGKGDTVSLSIRGFLLVTLTTFLSSCGYYHITKQQPGSNIGLGQKATLSFETVKSVVFSQHCKDCHSKEKGVTKMGVDLDTYQSTLASASLDDIKNDVKSGDMPKGSSMPQEAIDLVVRWIDAGAPEFSDIPVNESPTPAPAPAPEPQPTPAPQPPPLPEPAKVTFQELKTRLFVPLCVTCHKSYDKYSRVVANIEDIQTQIESNMMPKDGAPVNDELKSLLEQWIAQGTPEN
jgi:uncharacterized membrane protein